MRLRTLAFMDVLSSERYWFAFIGKLYGLYVTYKVFRKLWIWTKLYILSPTLKWATDVKSYGEWAVVTGATDGIGKCYAEKLAKKGMNVVLISRSAEKLNSVAKEIAEKCGNQIETKCVVADFSQDVSIYDKIEQEIKDLDIGVLVNNVGMLHEQPDYFDTFSKEHLERIIMVNCFSVVFMSKILIPKMVNKKKGLIINNCSQSAFYPCPLLALYAATKAFMHQLTVCLEQEYKTKGITFQCVSPSFVSTNMTNFFKYKFFMPGPESFVSSAIETIGLETHVVGCLSQEIQKTTLDLFSKSSQKFLSIYIMDFLKAISVAQNKQKN